MTCMPDKALPFVSSTWPATVPALVIWLKEIPASRARPAKAGLTRGVNSIFQRAPVQDSDCLKPCMKVAPESGWVLANVVLIKSYSSENRATKKAGTGPAFFMLLNQKQSGINQSRVPVFIGLAINKTPRIKPGSVIHFAFLVRMRISAWHHHRYIIIFRCH